MKLRKASSYKKPDKYLLEDLFSLIPDSLSVSVSFTLPAQGIRYLQYLKVLNRSPIAIKESRRLLFHFFTFCLERSVFLPTEVSRFVLESYQKKLSIQKCPTGKNTNPDTERAVITPLTQIKILGAIRQFFAWLTRSRVLLYNPAADLEYPKAPSRLPREWLSADEIEKVMAQPDLSTITGFRDRVMLEVLYSTGIRRTELCNLKVLDILWNQGYLRVLEGKGKKDRFVPIGERALLWLSRWISEHRPKLYLPPDPGYIFLTKTGQGVVCGNAGQKVSEYIKASGVKKKGSCHLFRHSFATQLLDAGADLRSIQLMLGHETIRTTQIYTHIAIKSLKETHARLHPAEKDSREEKIKKQYAKAIEVADSLKEEENDLELESGQEQNLNKKRNFPNQLFDLDTSLQPGSPQPHFQAKSQPESSPLATSPHQPEPANKKHR